MTLEGRRELTTPDNLFSLAGKRALVTGASKGIGLAIAQALAGAGAHVTLCARNADALQSAVQEIKRCGGVADLLPVDVTNLAEFEARVGELDKLDVFVNNAGTNRPKPLMDISPDDYDAVMDLNLRAAIFAARSAARKMIQGGHGGSIINISSQMGHVGAANRTLYCASKWALEGFTKAFSIEMGGHRIRVNTICPTFVETPMTRPFLEDPAFKAQVLAKIKLGRIGQVSDIVGAAIYLASDASSLMTGSALMLDGGWTAD